MITARIAYDVIMEKDSSVMDRANAVLAGTGMYTTLEKDYPFVESATWADKIKSKGFRWSSGWHFIDTPVKDDGFNKDIHLDKENVVYMLVSIYS